MHLVWFATSRSWTFEQTKSTPNGLQYRKSGRSKTALDSSNGSFLSVGCFG
jgi:hypothetical protein